MKISVSTLLLLTITLIIAGCTNPRMPYTVADEYIFIQNEERRNDSSEWELVWEDEFDKGALDTTHWTRIGLFTSPQWKLPVDRWQEHKGCFRYISATDNRVVTFDDDDIYLKGMVNPDTTGDNPRPYITGGIYTWSKFAWQYGRIEIRAKLDPAYGAWPAIWMLSENKKYPDQHNGEMDIMERLNHDEFVYQTNHNHWTLNIKQEEPERYTTAKINIDDYNVYSVSWYPDKLVYAINGLESITYPKVPGAGTFQWPYDQPFYLFLDQQLEGSWPGKITNPEELPINMTVDWVRLYQ